MNKRKFNYILAMKAMSYLFIAFFLFYFVSATPQYNNVQSSSSIKEGDIYYQNITNYYINATYNITNNLTNFYNSTYDTWLPNYTASSKYWYNMTITSTGTANFTNVAFLNNSQNFTGYNGFTQNPEVFYGSRKTANLGARLGWGGISSWGYRTNPNGGRIMELFAYDTDGTLAQYAGGWNIDYTGTGSYPYRHDFAVCDGTNFCTYAFQATENGITTPMYVNADVGLCILNDCRTEWPAQGGNISGDGSTTYISYFTSQNTISSINNIYYNTGTSTLIFDDVNLRFVRPSGTPHDYELYDDGFQSWFYGTEGTSGFNCFYVRSAIGQKFRVCNDDTLYISRINATIINATTFYGSGSQLTGISTFNSTYNSWAYNQTSEVKGSSQCSGTDKVINVTLTNGALSATCGSDQTGGSSSLQTYKSDEVTTNATGLTWVTLYTIPLTATTNYTINCYMLHSSNATTSGIRYNISLAGAPDYMTMAERASTSATASQYSVVSGATISLMPTAITASLAYPSLLPDELNIFIDGNANTGGNAILQMSGELAGLRAVIGRGSYCEVNIVT